MTSAEESLCEVGRWLQSLAYEFTTVTPETHRRVNARASRARAASTSLRDVFGWSRPFARAIVPPQIVTLLELADALDQVGDELRSRVRFSTLQGDLYVHSAYPTLDESSVFFGPDTYRFCTLLATEIKHAHRIIDLGCGTGAGGLSLARVATRIVLSDINERALSFARVNAALAECSDRVELVRGDLFAAIDGPFDCVIANPPYLVDAQHRAYRDGGEQLGTALALRMITDAVDRLRPGRLVMYTGAPIVDGKDVLRDAVAQLLDPARTHLRYRELDPDVFGDELDQPAYAAVDRIAAVALTVDCH